VEWCYESRAKHQVSINTGNCFANLSRRAVFHGVRWILRYKGDASVMEKVMRTTKKGRSGSVMKILS
jgi:hypothetical protein